MIVSKIQKQPKPAKVTASKVSPANASAVPSACCAHTQIKERAFEIFESRGSTHGDDMQDWLLAERLVMAS
jgi:hypothetical protein